jgi:hypothetical protein
MIFLIPIHLVVTYWSFKRLFFSSGKIVFFGLGVVGSITIYYFQIGFVLVFIIHTILILLARKGKQFSKYSGAKAIFEGGGIMRGLTPVEASILLETPYHEVLSLLFSEFALKEIVSISQAHPLKVEITEKISLGGQGDSLLERKEMRKAKAQNNHLLIYPYEDDFIEYLEQNAKINLTDLNFAFLVESLVERVADRVAGFNLPQTTEYYGQIIDRVKGEIEAGDYLFLTNEDSVVKNIGWLLLDNNLRDNILGPSDKLIPTLSQYENKIPFKAIRLVHEGLNSHKGKYKLSFTLGKNVNLTTAQFLADTNRATFSG